MCPSEGPYNKQDTVPELALAVLTVQDAEYDPSAYHPLVRRRLGLCDSDCSQDLREGTHEARAALCSGY